MWTHRIPADSSASDLVNLALTSDYAWKDVAAELLKRPPDTAAAGILIHTFQEGRAPAWLTAFLLGCLRDRSGYTVVRDILWSTPGYSGESYAGVAMARIAGAAARDDLLDAMQNAPTRGSREGAAYGLGELADDSLAPLLLEAARAGRIRSDNAATNIASSSSVEPLLREWLATDDSFKQAVALYAAFSLSATSTRLRNVELARAVNRALKTGVGPVSPDIKKMLAERIAPLL